MDKEFRAIPGFPDYVISRDGVVMRGTIVIKPYHGGKGAFGHKITGRVDLWSGGIRTHKNVRNLVISTWGFDPWGKTWTPVVIPDLPGETWKYMWGPYHISDQGRIKKTLQETGDEKLVKGRGSETCKKVSLKDPVGNFSCSYWLSELMTQYWGTPEFEVLPGEVFVSIPEWPDYQVSSLGRVRTINYRGTGRTKELSRFKVSNGYEGIKIPGEPYPRTVHSLVARLFIPNPDNKPEVDHINTVKTDNRVENLRWATSLENMHNPITKNKVREHLKKLNVPGRGLKSGSTEAPGEEDNSE